MVHTHDSTVTQLTSNAVRLSRLVWSPCVFIIVICAETKMTGRARNVPSTTLVDTLQNHNQKSNN